MHLNEFLAGVQIFVPHDEQIPKNVAMGMQQDYVLDQIQKYLGLKLKRDRILLGNTQAVC